MNQFNIGPQALATSDDGHGTPTEMLTTLTYGLFRPLSNGDAPDVQLTNQLLVNLTFQLRMMRRRGVIAMLANLATFLVAFIFSLVLAFDAIEDNSNPFSLALGAAGDVAAAVGGVYDCGSESGVE